MADDKKIKKRFVLAAVATALLFIPRRSSRKQDIDLSNNDGLKNDSNHKK